MNRRYTGITLVGLGAVMLVLVIATAPSDFVSAFVVTGPFLLIAAAVSFVGGWFFLVEEPVGKYGTQILGWTFGTAVTFAAIGYLLTLGTPASGYAGGMPVSVLKSFTAGSLAGILVGLYDARSRLRYDELQTERERVERFAYKAKSLNTYGKTLNESRDIHEVSALSTEVLELLIESSESAVVVVDDETISVLDTTLPGAEDFIERIASEVATGTSMETVRCPDDVDCSIPEDVEATEVLGVPIDAGDATIVLLAITRSAAAYTEEDLDLLESLSAHVGTALPNLDRGVTDALD